MIGLVARVIRGEGLPSAMRRAEERIGEAVDDAVMRLRGMRHAPAKTDILNVSMGGISLRLGGVQGQLAARLEVEREHRDVALLTPAFLQTGRPSRRYRVDDLFDAIRRFGARIVHFEGTFGVPIERVLQLIDDGFAVIVSVHDYSLVCDDPHLLDAPVSEQRVQLARRLMEAASAVVFPSRSLLEHHRQLLSLPLRDARVIEPGVRPPMLRREEIGCAVAFAGSVRRHKGAHLLPDLIRACNGEIDWHIFGGGDVAILRELRKLPRTTVHGYYRAGALPGLFAKHDVGLAVLPSIWPEAYLLTISEAWLAQVPVVAFDLGAMGERIRAQGGGWVLPLGADLSEIVRRWHAGELETRIPQKVVSAADAAQAYLDLYRNAGVLAG
jgi:glycosyltransferase involved in cell wall biosynthesis